MGLVTRFFGPNKKGSELTIKEMDDNLYYLQDLGVVGVNFSDGILTLTNPTGNQLSAEIDRYNRNFIPSGETFTVPNGYQNFVYGDVIVEGTLNIEETGELVVLNGNIIISGGSIVGSGTTYSVTLPEFNTFVTSGNFNPTTKQITFNGNFGFTPFNVDLSSLSTDNFYSSGGSYNSITKNIDFSGNSSTTTFSVDVSQLLDDTNTFTTGATLNGTTIEFDRNDISNAYSVDLTTLKFTGNTSGECISDIYVTNLNSCSPLHIQPTNNGDVYISESGGNVGIGTTNPQTTLDVNGDVNISNSLYTNTISATTYLNLSVDSFTGGTVNGQTTFTNGLSANTFSGNILFNTTPSTNNFNGDIIRLGTGTTTTGKVYYLDSLGGWSEVDCNNVITSNGLLGVAIGTNPSSDGMLIKGFVNTTFFTGTAGSPLYISSSSGLISEYPPTGSGKIIRIVGYKLINTNSIFFNPDPTWIQLT